MDMRTWLAETQRATASLIPLVWADQQEFEQAMRRYQELTAATEAGYRQAAAFQEDFDDDPLLANAIRLETYFGVDKERHHVGIEAENLSAKLEAWAFARASLASAILQIAKQGISAVQGKKDGDSSGRELCGVPIRDIIWYGRNQAMHWEERNFRGPLIKCFHQLAQSDPKFAAYEERNLAFEIVALLDWRDVDAFERDLMEICP